MAQRAHPTMATADVFQRGDIQWKQFNVDTSTASSSLPPKPLLLFTPTVPGTYPVILFCHGFCISNSYYSELLGHIASHGFILVAPNLFCDDWLKMFEDNEIKFAGKVVDWLVEGLQPLLPENVEANLKKLVLCGHSKGGKTAFCVALGHAKTNLKFSALIGIDPVAGPSESCQTPPHILNYVPRSFNLDIPIAVIGTGLGPEKAQFCFPACAPEGVNHKEFFNECKPPCAHFVVNEYGHIDMLDDEMPWLFELFLKGMCKNGKGPRDLMRRTVGGLVVAFLRAQLNDQWKDFDAILVHPIVAPAKLDDVVYLST